MSWNYNMNKNETVKHTALETELLELLRMVLPHVPFDATVPWPDDTEEDGIFVADLIRNVLSAHDIDKQTTPEPTVKLTFGYLLDNNCWDRASQMLGLSLWCINEGRASRDDTVELTFDQAKKLGLFV